ncbi:MAG: (Fe-S)-binding protein [Candidatus Rokubacteria bacterium]|nr:(Fe-S)-binding protein [Candidatus Rokubacteria bacterium]
MELKTLEAYLDEEAQDLTSKCTKCGKCFEVCPMINFTPLKGRESVPVVTDLVNLLRDGVWSDAVGTWAQACTGSGECITHCPEHINPRKMLSLAIVKTRRRQSAQGNNPAAGFYKRMSQTIHLLVGLQMMPERYRGLTGRHADKKEAEVVFYLGCNVLRTPHIVFNVLDLLDALEANYVVLGGVSNCCGIIHLKFHGDVDGADRVTEGTLDKLGAYRPKTVLHWCPSCVLHFGETTAGFRSVDFEFQHVTRFLVERLERLRPRMRPVGQLAAIHRHDAGLGVAEDVETLLGAIPGLKLVHLEDEARWAYTCGPLGLNLVPDAKKALHQRMLESARDKGVDMLVNLYHSCHRDLAGFEGEYPFRILNWTSLLCEALGLESHEDRFKRYRLLKDVQAVLEDAQEFIRANRLDPKVVEEILPNLLN